MPFASCSIHLELFSTPDRSPCLGIAQSRQMKKINRSICNVPKSVHLELTNHSRARTLKLSLDNSSL